MTEFPNGDIKKDLKAAISNNHSLIIAAIFAAAGLGIMEKELILGVFVKTSGEVTRFRLEITRLFSKARQ